MSNVLSPHDLQSLWQSQVSAPQQLATSEIQKAAEGFQSKIRRRNAREYVAAAFVIVIFGAYAWRAESWVAKMGNVLVVLGTLYIVWHMYVHAASRAVSDALVAESCITFHRRELERQRDLLQSIWRWYLGPLIPGLVVNFATRLYEVHAKGTDQLIVVLVSALFCTAVFIGIGKLNALGANKIQMELDLLGSSEEDR